LNLGITFHELCIFEQAARTFREIILLEPDHLQALNNLGKVNHDWGRPDQARLYYDRCVDLQPGYAAARFNRAVLLLALEDYEMGWQEYEWRFRRSCSAAVYPHRLPSPRWQGENFHGRRLLVHCEQGMGDVLQFIRYLPMVKQKGGTLILEVHEPLLPLLKNQSGIDEIVGFNPGLPPAVRHDLHVPLLSLPKVFHTAAGSIPNTLPYIEVHGDRACPGPEGLRRDRINIGLVWGASALDPRRNVPIANCSAWFRDPRFRFVSLQVGELSDQIHELKDTVAPITLLGKYLRNFQDTADAMADLDLVISVDTAAAHLAGAMGKPLWVLLPYTADWRWPLHRTNCPWYPQAKIFRQSKPGDWDGVIEQVSLALDRWPAGADKRRLP
jgi:tetratricopeptide (TPR) repeat protein